MDYNFNNILDDEDITIIDCEDKTTSNKHSTSRNRNKKSVRDVTVIHNDKKVETLVITQTFQLKKPKKKCLINFNTNICENTLERSRKQNKPPERIVPTCSRLQCKNLICHKRSYNNKGRSYRKKSLQNYYDRKISKTKDRKRNCKTKSRKRKVKTKEKTKATTKQVREACLSPISLTTLSSASVDHHILKYDDVSLGSFTCSSDRELETLIKEAKKREKQMAGSFNFLREPLCSSTPQAVIEISSDESSFADTKLPTASIYSQATLVLESQLADLTYSPVSTHDDKSETIWY